ncbi:hypothetical protein C5F52_21725 [Limnohabitans sp. TS-CS-82]|nr:hypothetical protein C5F52_21725 [Limnohabitans sp. TS-CS-82]
MPPGLRPFYKYSSPDGALAMLNSGVARYSTPLLFNDPFDIQAGLHFDFDPEQLHRAVVDRIGELAASSDEPPVDPQDIWGKVVLMARRHFRTHGFDREHWMLMTEPSFANLLEVIRDTQAQYQKHWHEVQLPQMRVFCVSEDRDNLLMWSHYAKDHTGAVFELWSLPDEDNPLSVAVPVNYVERPIAFFSMKEFVDDMVGIRKLDIRALYRRYACTKSLHWAYEKEWRVWYPLSKTDKYDFSPIRPSELKAVYLGCRSEQGFRDHVRRLVNEKYPEAKLFIAQEATGSYELRYADA